jgi:hypothetical protein
MMFWSNCIFLAWSTVKENHINTLNRYIDIQLIDEYADKDSKDGYSLDIDSIPEHTRANFLDELMKHDTSVRDLVNYAMQEMINERLPECELRDRENRGLTLVRLSNGDTMTVAA